MTDSNLQDAIVSYTCSSDWVSVGELMNSLGRSDLSGTCSIEFRRGLVIVVGISELFAQALQGLLRESPPRVVFAPCPLLILLIDGCPIPMSMPIARSSVRDYKTPHFLPVCLRPAAKVVKAAEARRCLR